MDVIWHDFFNRIYAPTVQVFAFAWIRMGGRQAFPNGRVFEPSQTTIFDGSEACLDAIKLTFEIWLYPGDLVQIFANFQSPFLWHPEA